MLDIEQIGFALAGVAEEYDGMTQIGNIALEYMFSWGKAFYIIGSFVGRKA